MIRILNDFNKIEGLRGNGWAVVLHIEHTPPEALVPGTRVIVCDPGQIECEAIVRPGKHYPWVAEIIEDTLNFFED